MAKDLINYEDMIEKALRGVVASALKIVEEKGLLGAHHFYITFMTHHPGVEIPDYLSNKYPDEMTIVLQYEFWGLEVSEEGFVVTLSFNSVPERLVIPFAAITGFADPSVRFGLQFHSALDDADLPGGGDMEEVPTTKKTKKAKSPARSKNGDDDNAPPMGDNVITLDSFRKK